MFFKNKPLALLISIGALSVIILTSIFWALLSQNWEKISQGIWHQDTTEEEAEEKAKLVFTSNKAIKIGEIFTIIINPAAIEDAKEVKIYIDGELITTCTEKDEICQAKSGPYEKEDVGDHNFSVSVFDDKGVISGERGEFEVLDEESAVETEESGTQETSKTTTTSGTTTQKTSPTVPKATDTTTKTQPLPEYEKIITSGSEVEVGELFTTTIYAKDKVALSKIQVIYGGKVFHTCVKSLVCGAVFGPMTVGQIGTVSYKYILTAENGEKLTVNSSFQVVPEQTQTYNAPKVSVSPNKQVIGATEQVLLTAKVNSGSEEFSYVEIIVNKKLVKSCSSLECVYLGGPYTEYAGSQINYAATAYFKSGTWLTTGYSTVAVNPLPSGDNNPPPTPAQPEYVEPTISVVPDKVYVQESDTVTFLATGTAGSKEFHHINIYINGPVVKTCDTLSCYYIGGPYPAFAGSEIEYKAAIFFTDGSYKVTTPVMLSIKAVPKDPTISVHFDPVQKSNLYMGNEVVTFTTTVNPEDKQLMRTYVYINGLVASVCHQQEVCAYSSVANMLRTNFPGTFKGDESYTYYGKAYFSDGSFIQSGNQSVTIMLPV